jgi:hypothetical protein
MRVPINPANNDISIYKKEIIDIIDYIINKDEKLYYKFQTGTPIPFKD